MDATWRIPLQHERPLRRFRFLGMIVDEFLFPATRFGGKDGIACLIWVRAGCIGHPIVQIGRQVLPCPTIQVQYPMTSKFGFLMAQAMVMRAYAHHYGLVAGERNVTGYVASITRG